ncbi:MAG TPA: URC4/urg3 family protein [Xanthobacteraceae bacterium]|nr:URC4/urg3 family protein [Xanthobacteraceae bacterium]
MSAPATARETSAPAELIALRNAAAVRERCARVRDWVAAGRSPHFTLNEAKLDDAAALVADVTRASCPDLVIPHHSRWRHFSAGGRDRWAALPLGAADALERTRVAIDLAVVSVLLDAGAGAVWSYHDDDTGIRFARSEGLAVASIDMFRVGAFSSDPARPLQADARALAGLQQPALTIGLQVSSQNPLVGLPQRLTLLRRLGAALAARPDLFGAVGRPGHLIDGIFAASRDRTIAAADILAHLLDGLSSIWPSGLTVDGIALGDAGFHPAVRTRDRSDRIVPFHKLSQWLAYSLIEPIEQAGMTVTDVDGLTALPEYRNGGLLIDAGVIVPRAPLEPAVAHDVASELIVEWRALTVALLEKLREPVRRRLGLASLAMSQLLQGGTWLAGRTIAARLRPPDGPPPISVRADGTVF